MGPSQSIFPKGSTPSWMLTLATAMSWSAAASCRERPRALGGGFGDAWAKAAIPSMCDRETAPFAWVVPDPDDARSGDVLPIGIVGRILRSGFKKRVMPFAALAAAAAVPRAVFADHRIHAGKRQLEW